jgi:tRNA-binding protein
LTDPAEELQRIELVVGRIVDVADHPGARAPSYLLTLDLGGRGRREASVPAGDYPRDELRGRQVVCALGRNDALVLGAHSRSHGLVLLVPDRDVEDGTAVS